MTQAPTPGPLSASDVKLLVKGDLLRVTCDTLIGEPSLRIPKGTVVEFEVSEHGLVGVQGDFWGHSAFAFIGRPDADGWMPWSGGENPVPGQRVDFQEADGATNLVNCASEVFDVWHKPGRFRLAPTAPVEASGSEREIALGQFQPFSDFPDLAAHIGRMGATGQLGSLTDWDAFLAALNAAVSNKEGHIPPINAATVIAYEDAHAVAVEMGYPSLTEALEHLSELRPQPSGETRECGWCDGRKTKQTSSTDFTIVCPYCKGSGVEVIRPAPVASGGQHSSGEGTNRECKECGAFKPELSAACIFCGSTTPARAEALDEGAAGEPVAWRYHLTNAAAGLHRDSRGAPWTYTDEPTSILDGQRIVQPLYAHQSPTPAADADRVREAAIVAKNMADNASFNLNQAGLTTETATCDRAFLDIYRTLDAALKSTAAQEGGSK